MATAEPQATQVPPICICGLTAVSRIFLPTDNTRGCAVNFMTTTVSYKVHKTIYNPVEEQQVISNMQESIISEDRGGGGRQSCRFLFGATSLIFLYMLAKNNTAARQSEVVKLKQTIATSERRIQAIGKAIEGLFEANISGKITDERFTKMAANYEKKQKELLELVADGNKRLQDAMEEIRQNPQQFKLSA